MEHKEYHHVGFTLDNGMKISLHRTGIGGTTNMGEHLDLCIEHPNGDTGRVSITCSGFTEGDKYVEFAIKHGQSLSMGKTIFREGRPSFRPDNLYSVAAIDEGRGMGGGIECLTKGEFRVFKLLLSENSEGSI